MADSHFWNMGLFQEGFSASWSDSPQIGKLVFLGCRSHCRDFWLGGGEPGGTTSSMAAACHEADEEILVLYGQLVLTSSSSVYAALPAAIPLEFLQNLRALLHSPESCAYLSQSEGNEECWARGSKI